ncbi:GIY-YIG nuclease family protein [Candidatus Daviesbacteria bacterium]|nr:GIY-YIG nuclease family protein [Candidatus Daviesbacteria bacterium]
MWFVYILLCKDHSLYTGITNNLEKRFSEHKNGTGGRYTRSHKPIKIVYQESCKTKSKALKRENQIKSWTREKKIRILIKKDLNPP